MKEKNNLFLMRSLFVVILMLVIVYSLGNELIIISGQGIDEDIIRGSEKYEENVWGEQGDNVVDISKLMGLEDNNITGKGLKYDKQGDITKLIFDKKNSQLEIDGNKFENINPKSDGGRRVSSIELDKKGDIAKADFATNEKGGTYVLGNRQIKVPANSRVIYNRENNELTIKPENGAKIKELPKLKDDSKKGVEVIYEGENYKINGINVNGKLGYNEGKFFVAPGQNTIINGVDVENINSGFIIKNTDVYFDGKEHKGRYVSFGKTTFVASSTNGVIDFKESNPYLKIDKGDYVAIDLKSLGYVEIKNRDAQGLISKVTTKGSFTLDEDSKSIYSRGKKVKMEKMSFLNKDFKGESTTSPIELVMVGEDGLPLIKNHKIFVDNFNRYAIVPESAKEVFVKSEGVDTKFSARVKYNYPREKDMRKLTKARLNFKNLLKGNKDMVMGKFRDYWKDLTPEMKNSVGKYSVNFVDDKSFGKLLEQPSQDIVAFAQKGKGMTFRANNNFDYDTFLHESSHMRTYSLNDLEGQWKKIAGDVYGKDGYFDKVFSRKGIIKDYGATNYREDIATHMEIIAQPSKFAKFINKDKKHLEKLDLLHEKNFISTSKYNDILREAGLK